MTISLKGLFSGITVGTGAIAAFTFLYAHLVQTAVPQWALIALAALAQALGIATHHAVSKASQ